MPKAPAQPQGQLPQDSPGAMAKGNTINASLLHTHNENVRKVLAHEVFVSLMDSSPIGISDTDDSGFQAVFDMQTAVNALSRNPQHLCGINAAWVAHSPTLTPNVPMAWASVLEMKSHYFQVPTGFAKVPVEIAVTKAEVQQGNFGPKGYWRRVSADETFIAWFSAVADAIDAGKSIEELCEWRRHALTTPVVFHVVDTMDDVSWLAEQLRENISANATLVRSTVQRIFDINQRRIALNDPEPEALQKIYQTRLTTSARSEEVSLWFMKSAYAVWDTLFRIENVKKIVLEEEAFRGHSMFNTMSKLLYISEKAKTPADIEFAVALVHDFHLAGIYTTDDLKSSEMKGKASTNGKGLVDIWIYKRKMLQHLLSEVLGAVALSTKIKEQIRDVCKDFPTFRAKVGTKFESAPPDQS